MPVSLILRAAAVGTAAVSATQSNPLGEVVDLLNGLSANVKSEGEAEAKAFKEYAEWCSHTNTETGFEIKTAKSTQGALEATISKLTGDMAAMDSKVEDLASNIALSTSQLKDATSIRDGEAADFAASEKELVEVIDTLGRAVTLISREMQKKNAAFTQLASKDFSGLLHSLDTIVDAAALTGTDKQRLSALIQSTQSASDDDKELELGAPAAAVYESHSGSILDTLEDLKEKGEEQLSAVRKAEVNARHNYGMVKQSLEDQNSADNKDLDEEKASKAAASESHAGAEGDLSTTVADLQAAETALATAQSTCGQVSADHESTVAARAEELNVISEAIGVLKSTTSGGVQQAYSFFQDGLRIRTRADLARSEVLTLIKKLAKQQHSTALSQLASRITAAMRYSTGSEAPFDKVKGLISDMISKLQSEAGADATEKAFCDEETAKSQAQRTDLEATISKLTTKIDSGNARSASLKADVKELQDELAKLAGEEAEMIKIRQETHADYVQAKADYNKGLGGVRQALVMLRAYYAKSDAAFIQGAGKLGSLMQQPAAPETFSKAGGAGNSIIGILEVVESDFATNLAKEETSESTAQDAFDKITQENKITRASKEQDIKYKSAEAVSTDKSMAELSSDLETTNTENAAVIEYLRRLDGRCVAKPETYESRKERRVAEIAGLKEALSVLEQTAFVQRKGRHMRSSLRAGA